MNAVETIGFDYGQRHAIELDRAPDGAVENARAVAATGTSAWARTT
jgi:7-cyano-7-deazaguanine synthase in queuosine biosynthesis